MIHNAEKFTSEWTPPFESASEHVFLILGLAVGSTIAGTAYMNKGGYQKYMF